MGTRKEQEQPLVQRVRFGQCLDGERGWHARDALGESTLGPLGFLGLLELQLGLVRAEVPRSERVVQMRECLAAARTGSRFYERSFAEDELGTAAVLLTWRDEWLLNGWNGQGESGRVADLAAVEALASRKVAPGVGQRLREVASVLEQRQPQVAAVEVLEPIETLPTAWRNVLKLLPGVVESAAIPQPVATAGTVLHDLQLELLAIGSGATPGQVHWRSDGSLRVVRAETVLVAADWVAAELGRAPTADRLIVAQSEGARLDAALRAIDQPLQGLLAPSAFRPALQVLPLVLRLIWEPLDFGALMQFLTHPVGPLPQFARRKLAESMASTPGIGGIAWREALEAIAARFGDRGADVVRDVEYWICSPRYRAIEQAPLDAVMERVARVLAFFQARLTAEDEIRRAGAIAAHHQARDVHRSLGALLEQGERHIRAEALDKLVEQATSHGTINMLFAAEAGAGGRVGDPGAVVEPFDEVCWWHMGDAPLPAAYPWSAEELRQLQQFGVTLPSMAQRLEFQAAASLRPVLHARRRLTLMLPASGEESHPLWLMLQTLMQDVVIELAEAVLSGPVGLDVKPVPQRPLQRRRRWWQVPAGAIRGWQYSASYSSLQQFIYNPYQWALNYPAKLKASALLDLPNDSQLYGSLAHRVFERLYGQPDALGWPLERVSAWFEEAFEGILREEGAVLYMPGRAADRETLHQCLRRALGMLHRQLQLAGAVRATPEQTMNAETPLGPMIGTSDLLVTLPGERQAVVDMKWSGTGWYGDQIKAQGHIQLAIYARLVEQGRGHWPAVAYFILRDAQLLTTADDTFPGVSPIRVPGASTALVWERLVTTWGWRRGQIEAGQIELVLEDVEPTAESAAPSLGLAIEPLGDRFNPYVHLAGWAPDA